MGCKYIITAFDYPYKGYMEYHKQTDHLIVALFWLVVYTRNHFGVTLEKRGL